MIIIIFCMRLFPNDMPSELDCDHGIVLFIYFKLIFIICMYYIIFIIYYNIYNIPSILGYKYTNTVFITTYCVVKVTFSWHFKCVYHIIL